MHEMKTETDEVNMVLQKMQSKHTTNHSYYIKFRANSTNKEDKSALSPSKHLYDEPNSMRAPCSIAYLSTCKQKGPAL